MKFKKGQSGMLGKHHSEESKSKISNSHKGIKLSDMHRKRLSESHMGYIMPKEQKIKIGLKSLGRKLSEETKLKMRKPKSEEFKKKLSNYHKGLLLSNEIKEKISKAHLGKKFSEEHKLNISIGNIGKIMPRGDKCHSWKGGLSFEPYTIDWNNTLKKSIRERDHYICQVCNNEGYPIHHIDYNKKNCNPNNLVTLCKKCHSKTNFNREKWIEYFTNNEKE